MQNSELMAQLAMGNQLMADGSVIEAVAFYRKLLLANEHPELFYKLGVALARNACLEEAEDCYRRVLALDPMHARAANNLGILLARRNLLTEAEAMYRKALATDIGYFEPHINLGNILVDTSRLDEAEYFYRRAVSINPDSATAHDRLGTLFRRRGRTSDAVISLRRAVELDPALPEVWNNLGVCLLSQGYMTEARFAEANATFRTATELLPGFLDAWRNLIYASNFRSMPVADSFRLAGRYGALLEPTPLARWDSGLRFDPVRRLRVGFVSGDLRWHSVSYFLERVLIHLDREKVSPWAYYAFPVADDRTESLHSLFDAWRDVAGMTDEQLAAQIVADRIDVLVDLAGHTGHSRLAVFARKPAPVQVAWIGYPATTGVRSIDYRLTDSLADPPRLTDDHFTEALWRLPRSFLCYAPPSDAPEPAPAPCLDRGTITFGSFNAARKISSETLALWCAVLSAVPDSRIVLKSIAGLDGAEECLDLRAAFSEHGVDPGRIVILESVSSLAEHLAQYARMDVALDTFPYHGTTSTCEALWMGVPVISRIGDRHASRVGLSLLSNAGLPELATHSDEEFIAIATALATDRSRLDGLRTHLRDRLAKSPLLDGAAMANDFADALRAMWELECRQRVAGGGDDGPVAAAAQETPRGIWLHIGGVQVKAGWKILNALAGEGADFVGDVRDLGSFEPECCEQVYCSHVLEHIPQAELFAVLKGIHRILQPGGRLYVSVPDLEILCRLFLDPQFDGAERFEIMRIIYGGQVNSFDYHFIGLTLEFMIEYLKHAGFSTVERVTSFEMFDDISDFEVCGTPISLNLLVEK